MAEVVARSRTLRRGVRLEWVTVMWMAIEAILAIGAGIAARSALLPAFGTVRPLPVAHAPISASSSSSDLVRSIGRLAPPERRPVSQ